MVGWGAFRWQPRVVEASFLFHGAGPQAWEALGALGVKGLGWLNSECVRAREIRLQR